MTGETIITTPRTGQRRVWRVVRELPASTPQAAENLRRAIGCVRQAAVESVKGRSGLAQFFEDGTVRVCCMNATTEYVQRE